MVRAAGGERPWWHWSSSPLIPIVLLWMIVTAFNVTKAVHIDDPAYLYCARAAARDWLRPYAGEFNWGRGTMVPLSSMTQPALSFYPLALSLRLFGEAEVPLHLIQSLYVLLAIVCFFQIVTTLRAPSPLFLTALFCISPSFIPSQNLMTDLPLLSLLLLTFLLLLTGITERTSFFRLLGAGAVAGLACLTKYSAAIILPVYFSALWVRRTRNTVVLFFVPIAALIVWSLVNYFDYGGVHLLRPQTKEVGQRFSENSINWIICLGAIAPFSLLFMRTFLIDWFGRLLLVGICSFALLWTPAVIERGSAHEAIYITARVCWANGLVVCIGALLESVRCFVPTGERPRRRVEVALFLIWIVNGFLFITLFSRFMAVRHVLLVIPPLLFLLSVHLLQKTTVAERLICLLVTAMFGMWLGVSDWRYADLYRQTARNLADRYAGEGQLWSNGSWGWQWYSLKAGMKSYTWDAALSPGDIVVAPALADPVVYARNHGESLLKLEEFEVPATPLMWLRTMSIAPWGGFYSSQGYVLPWQFSRAPVERFQVFLYAPQEGG